MDHDAFQYLYLQYVVFNEASHHGSLPQWFPFTTQGSPGNFWIVISQGVLVSALSFVAPLLRHVNFLNLYEAGVLFDDFVLLLGCMLLAERYYRSPVATIFVSVSIAYTAISSSQPWFDFHLFYFLPLILYGFDRALREASARYLFLAGLFGAATIIGNLPYFAPLIVFTLCVFGATVVLFAPRKKTAGALRKFAQDFSWRNLLALLIPLCMICALAFYLKEGFAHTAFGNQGRGAHGEVSLPVFLTYGGSGGFDKYRELISRYPTNRDNTVYAGMLVVPFLLVALARSRMWISYTFASTALVLILFSAGTFVSAAFYYLFPLGRYYRHIGLTTPLVKLFIVFYAGFGVEIFWMSVLTTRHLPWSSRDRRDRLTLLIPFVTLMVELALMLPQRVWGTRTFEFPSRWPNLVLQWNALHIGLTTLDCLLLLIFGYLVMLLALFRCPKYASILASGLIAFHGLDVLWLKAQLESLRAPQVSGAVLNLFIASDYEFPFSRSQNYFFNRRFATLAPAILKERVLPGFGETPSSSVGRYGGSLYWTVESFLFIDSTASPFRTDFWQDGIDAFYHSWVPPSKGVPEHLGFPIPESTSYRKLSGLGFPKLQVFSKLHVAPDDNAIATILGASNFAGDQIFVSRGDAASRRLLDLPAGVAEQRSQVVLSANDRLARASVVVQEFTFDTLNLRVKNPSLRTCVLYYADAWDPEWRAFVNGAPTPVIRTNLGYKSVVLPPGTSQVIFRFGGLLNRLLTEGTAALSVLVVVGIFSLLIDLRRNCTPPN